MVSAVQRVFGLPPVPRALRVIVELSDEQFRSLESAVGGPEAFTVRHPRPTNLADALGLSEVSDAVAVLSSIEFLYENLHSSDSPPQSVPGAVEELLKSFGLWSYLGDSASKGLDRLARLLARNPSVDREKKRRWLQTGMLDHAFGFASFVDLRPNFTSDRSKIDEYIPAILFKVEVQKENGSEDAFVFQLTEEGLSEMRKAVEDVYRKLKRLKSDGIIPSIAGEPS